VLAKGRACIPCRFVQTCLSDINADWYSQTGENCKCFDPCRVSRNLTAGHRNATPTDQNAPRARNPNVVDHVYTTGRPLEPPRCGLRKIPTWRMPPWRLWTTLMDTLPLLTTNTGVHGEKTRSGQLPILSCQTKGQRLICPFLGYHRTTEIWSCK